MKYVQIVLTDYQAGLAGSALTIAREESDDEQEKEMCSQLADFFFTVSGNPSAFPIKSPEMARSIKKRMSRLKGPAAPKRANPRKRAQLRSQGSQKRSGIDKRMAAAVHNLEFERMLEESRAVAERLAQENEPAKKIVRVPWRKNK